MNLECYFLVFWEFSNEKNGKKLMVHEISNKFFFSEPTLMDVLQMRTIVGKYFIHGINYFQLDGYN